MKNRNSNYRDYFINKGATQKDVELKNHLDEQCKVAADNLMKKKKEFELLENLKRHAYLELTDTDTSHFEEKLKKVEQEIENLPEQCKKVFIMNKKEGLKYKEISEKLHISIKTVEVHMTKALKRLRAQLTIFF